MHTAATATPINTRTAPEDVLKVEPKAGVLRPSYVIIRDRKLQSIVLAVRCVHVRHASIPCSTVVASCRGIPSTLHTARAL